MLTIGHRGLKDEYPENTPTAAREAARYVDVVEIDVRRCGSGELVAVHDDDLERLTGHAGRVSGTGLTRLRELTVADSDEPIATFDELLEAWPAGTGLNADLEDASAFEDVVERIETSPVGDPVIVSVGRETLDGIDPASADASIGLSFVRDHVENVRGASAAGCEYVHVPSWLCLETDVVDRAHSAGLAVDAWAVHDGRTTARLEELGVDAVTVDGRDALP